MKCLFRFPVVFALSLFALNFVVCSLTLHETKEAPFRLGESIIRYGEEMERTEKDLQVLDRKNVRPNIL
ncbi:MAG: hypothetical protein O9264_17875 [Leptospira sp.]|jgi:hypothetical protein|nr:hypothetical protein [Leptospira sp.]